VIAILSIKSNAKNLAAFVGLATVATLAQAVSPASAADSKCSATPGVIDVGNGICEITFPSNPIGYFAVPAGVNKLQALLVGGGSGASAGYTGTGGEVKVVNLATKGDITFNIAFGAEIGNPGNDTSVMQNGKTYTAKGGTPDGNTSAGSSGAGGPGGEDKGNNSSGNIGSNPADMPSLNGGPGLVVKNIPGATLFANDNNCYGGGGASSAMIGEGSDIVAAWQGAATCGGGSTTINVDTDVYTAVAAVEHSGGGAGSYPFGDPGRAGASGQVVLRYTFGSSSTGLANTGGTNSVLPYLVGSALIAAGAFTLRRRSN
jgi:LPXTG-motif cell wall-anchored protein